MYDLEHLVRSWAHHFGAIHVSWAIVINSTKMY